MTFFPQSFDSFLIYSWKLHTAQNMKISIKDFLSKVARPEQWLLASIQKNFKVMKKRTKRTKYKEIIRKCAL